MKNLIVSEEVKTKSKKTLKWSLLAEIFAKIATPLSTMVLARLLAPEIFGIATAVTMVVSFCESISETGLAKFLIQQDFESEDEYKKYISVSLISSLAMSIILLVLIIIFRYQISVFVGNSGYESLLVVSCLQIPFTAINSIFLSNLKRKFRFDLIFIVRILYCLVPFVITVPLAYFGMGAWSLAIGTIAAQVIQTPLLIIFSRKQIVVHFSLSKMKFMLSRSYIMIIESVIIWMCSWAATFVATQFFDGTTVGIVKVSSSTITSIFSIFNSGFTAVLFSSLSRIKNNESEYQDAFFSLQSTAFSLMVPLSIGCFFFADTITDVFLGNQWAAAIKVIALFGLTKCLNTCFNNFLGEVFRSKGHFISSIVYQVFILIFDLTLKFSLGRLSFNWFIWTSVISNVAVSLVAIILLKTKYRFSIKKQLSLFIPSIICSLIMLPVLIVHKMGSYGLFESILQIIACIALYFVFGLIFFRKIFINTFSYLGLLGLDKKNRLDFSKTIYSFFKRCFKKERLKSNIINSLLIALSFVSLLTAGSFSKNTKFENTANQIANVIDVHTIDKEYSYLLVEGLDNEHKTQDSYRQYVYWYNVFNGGSEKSRNAFFGVVNGNKELNSNFVDILQNEQLTFIYTNFNNNQEYNGHWIHEYYHIELMFKGIFKYDINKCSSFVYITEEQARLILNLDNPTKDDYESLLGQPIRIQLENDIYSWSIANIILKNNDVDDCITKLFGNWVMTGTYFPDNFRKQYCYVFNKYEYQNTFKVKYISNNYSNNQFYSVKYGTSNFVDNDFLDNSLPKIPTYNKSNIIFEILFVVLFFILQFACFYLFIKRYSDIIPKFSFVYVFLSAVLVYSLSKIIYLLTKNILFFSYYGLIFFLLGLIADVGFYLIVLYLRRHNNEN